MKRNLLRKIEADLGLMRFASETDCDYNQRVIYSVAAAWAKTLIWGKSYSDQESTAYQSVDIMYVQSQLSKVLEAYFNCFEINLDWMDEEAENGDRASLLASEIISASIRNQNIAEIHSRRLSPLLPRYIKYADDLFLLRGNNQGEKDLFAVGASVWKKAKVGQYDTEFWPIAVNADVYYEMIDTEFQWRREKLTSEYYVFQLESNMAFSKSWKMVEPDQLSEGIHLLKLASEYNGGYVLIKKLEHGYKIISLDPWYIETGEVYRFIYTLKAKNQTPVEFRYQRHKDYILLKSYCPLPNAEKQLLLDTSWPYRTYKDLYYRIIPLFLWNVVEKQLCELGVKLIEQGSEHEGTRNSKNT